MTSIAHLMLIAIHISSHILLLYFKQLIFVYFLTYSNSSRFSSNSEASERNVSLLLLIVAS